MGSFIKNFEILNNKMSDCLDEIRSVGNIRNADINRSALLEEELNSLRNKVTQLEGRIQELIVKK